MSVIVSRALPDVRDGLKPVHRRILYAMQQRGCSRRAATRSAPASSARCSSTTTRTATARSTTRWCAWPRTSRCATRWSTARATSARSTATPPAAYRYTEARLTRARRGAAARHRPRDGRLRAELRRRHEGAARAADALPEPARERLVGHRGRHGDERAAAQPARAGRRAHARGARTPTARSTTCSRRCPGPDFPTGAIICGREGIRAAYATGRGLLTVRARAEIETSKRGERIVVTEIPYMVNKAALRRAHRRARERGQDRRRLRPARRVATAQGMRVVIELKKDAPGRGGAEPALQADADADARSA